MEQAGVQLIAQGAGAYVADMDRASRATSGFVSETDKGAGIVSRAGGMMGSAISNVASIAAGVGVAAFAALGAAIIGGVGDAREAAQLLAQTEAVIKSTGGAAGLTATQVTDLATALSAASGQSLFGDSDIQAAENLLLTFTNIKGAVFEAATAISVDMAQALGGAPKDQAIALGKALNDPIQGITALTRVGVTFTDQQKEQIKTMQEAGDIAGAQQIILAELNREFGGSAKAAADADGGWAQFKDTMGEVAESIGAAVLPILNDLAAWLNSPAVKQGIQDFADAMIEAFGWVRENIPPIIKTVTDVVSKGVALITSVFQNDLAPALQENAGFFKTTFDQIASIVESVWGILKIIFAAGAQFINDHGEEIQRYLKNTWDFISNVIGAALTLIQGILKAALQILQGDWEGAWKTIQEMSARFVEQIWQAIKAGIDNIILVFQGLSTAVGKVWDSMVSSAAEIGGDIIDGIIDGVQAAAGSLMRSLTNLAEDALQAAKDALGIGSPSKVFFKEAGVPIVQGIMGGIESMLPALMDLIGITASEMIQGLRKNIEEGTKEIEEMAADLVDRAKGIAADINDAIADGFGATASIDRQIAKNLDKFEDVLPQYRKFTEGALKEAQRVAEQFLDPTQGAKFFKMRSDQILEYAKLQQKLAETTSAEERARIEAQMLLINKAQTAEMRGFEAANAARTAPSTDIANQIRTLFSGNDLSGKLPGALENTIVNQLMSLLSQLQTPQANAYANPPMYYPPSGAGGPSYTSNRTVNMPVYTNQTPAAIQQSAAITWAAMP